MKAFQLLFQMVLTLLLFILWAAFALLVINPYFHSDLAGYTIGQLCIWELIFLILAAILARMIIKSWGYPEFATKDDQRLISMNSKYGSFFLAYFILGMVVAVWQFWVFSQKF